jgi:crotonobetainyl-CoA:carnitine CoA-transferase CaiB-like acyl-CoA transferase
MADNGSLPLGRYSVLDLTRARAGPTCVRQLVDWGARAIKIEMPGGRSGDGMGGNRHGFDFQNLHRNKRSMTLNLREPDGRHLLARPRCRHRGGELPARREAASGYRHSHARSIRA